MGQGAPQVMDLLGRSSASHTGPMTATPRRWSRAPRARLPSGADSDSHEHAGSRCRLESETHHPSSADSCTPTARHRGRRRPLMRLPRVPCLPPTRSGSDAKLAARVLPLASSTEISPRLAFAKRRRDWDFDFTGAYGGTVV